MRVGVTAPDHQAPFFGIGQVWVDQIGCDQAFLGGVVEEVVPCEETQYHGGICGIGLNLSP